MADNTTIEWTDATWNVVNGCTVHSPGCANCYAMLLAATRLKSHPSRIGLARMHNGHAQWSGEVRFNDKVLLDPLAWKRPRRIFVCAHGDLFHEAVPDDWIDQVFAVMALAPQHQFQVLTKRADRMRAYLTGIDNGGERLEGEGWRSALVEGTAQKIWHDRTGDDSVDEWLAVHLPLKNVWLGVSVEDQVRADERVPLLLDTPAAVRWLSCEPLLGPIDLTMCAFPAGWARCECPAYLPQVRPLDRAIFCSGCCEGPESIDTGIDWVVAGGESGADARPMHPAWARALRDQCADADVPFLFKQWGAYSDAHSAAIGNITMSEGICQGYIAWPDGTVGHGRAEDKGGPGIKLTHWHHKRDAGRLLDGQLHDGFPG